MISQDDYVEYVLSHRALQDRVERVLALIDTYGDIEEHKTWIIEEVVQILCITDKKYREWVKKHQRGEDEYPWETGVIRFKKGNRNMENMVGKDNTLLEAVREQEKAVEMLMQTLELNKPPSEIAAPYTACSVAAEQKIQDAIHRLEATRREVVEATDLVGRLIKAIGK